MYESFDDRYTIDTPENIAFDYDIGGIGSRFFAALIDSLLILLAEIIVFLVAGFIAARFAVLDGSESVLIGLASLLAFVILWGYYIVFEMVWNGQTPGKRLIRLRVVRDGGRPITFVSSAIRNLIRIVDLLPSFYGVGVVTMFIDSRSRRLGDLAAGTLVVKERAAVSLQNLLSESAAPPAMPVMASAPALPAISLLRPDDYAIVQEFLARRAELGRDARTRLGQQIASGIQARLGMNQAVDAEAFLQQVAAEYHAHQQAASSKQQAASSGQLLS